MRRSLALLFLLVAGTVVSSAATQYVNAFGTHGWMSDDTRDAAGVDLVGVNYTHYGKPGQTPTAADDVAIAQQIQFVAGPAGSTYGGAVMIDGTSSNSGKSTLSVIDVTSGFAPAADLVGGSFSATYQWYMEPNTTQRTLAFRLNIQSTAWGTGPGQSQNGYTAIRSGESAWDLVLVHLMDSPAANAWNTPTVDMNNGNWYLYGQAGNGNWVAIAGSAPPGGTIAKTLAAWQADTTWGPFLFGSGAKVACVQFGFGSGQRNCRAYVDYLQTTVLNGGDVIDFTALVRNVNTGQAYGTIQAAIDAASPGDTINVYPGNYNETATNRYVLGASGPYQFGLFIDKADLTIQGVDAYGTPITSAAAIAAFVTTNATNSFGYSGTFVQADGVTITGLEFGQNIPGTNKTIEVIGDDLTLKYCRQTDGMGGGGGSLYFNDWQFDTINDISHVQTYHIEGCEFLHGNSIDLTSGAGYSGPVSGRKILDNTFDMTDTYSPITWPVISFNGSNTGVPWFVQSVGGAIITGNAFVDGPLMYIRARGDYDNSQFDWESYWNDNTFDKAVVALADEPTFDVRGYTYTSGSYTFNNTRRIGTTIQGEINSATAGDTVLVADGTYAETVVCKKSLDIRGAGCGQTLWTASTATGIPLTIERNSASPANIAIELEALKLQTQQNQLIYAHWSPSYTETLELDIHDNCFEHINTPWDLYYGQDFGLYVYGASQLARGASGAIRVYDNTFDTHGGLLFENCRAVDVLDNEFDCLAEGVVFNYYSAVATYGEQLVRGNDIHLTGPSWSEGGLGMNNWFGSPGTYTLLPNVVEENTIYGANVWWAVLYGVDAAQSSVHDYQLHGNSIGGDVVVWGPASAPILLDASGNWWGSSAVASVADQAGSQADYTPWLDTGTDTELATPGFQGDFSTLWVDDDSPQTGTTGRVQEAVDLVSGSTINVLPGLYEEQVVIDEPDLVLDGAGDGTNPAVDSIIRAPSTLAWSFTTGSNSNFPVLGVHDALDVTIRDLRVDGYGRGNGNYRFLGIGFWNADGEVRDCTVTGIRETPLSGSQHGVGIYSWNNGGGPCTLDVLGTTVEDYQKNGMTIGGTGVTANVVNCDVYGSGPLGSGLPAQNGIQFSGLVAGSISETIVRDHMYTPGTWAACGVLIFGPGGTIAISDTDLDDNFPGLYATDTSATLTDCRIRNLHADSGDGLYADNATTSLVLHGGESVRARPSALDVELMSESNDARAATLVTVTRSEIIGHDEAYSWGLGAFSTGTQTSGLLVTQSTIRDWDLGIVGYYDVPNGYDGPIDVDVNGNIIISNVTAGAVNLSPDMMDATGNYWGAASGPLDLASDAGETVELGDCTANPASEKNADGGGNAVDDTSVAVVDFCPFNTSASTISLLPQGGGVCYDPNNTFVVEIKLTGATVPIVGGQFYLSYDNTRLTFVSADPGDAPFTRQIVDLGFAPNKRFYAVGVPDGDPGTSADTVMARLTFTVNTAASGCDLAALVAFLPDDGALQNKLSDNLGNPVLFAQVALPPISIDVTPPVITCPPNVTIGTDPNVCSGTLVTVEPFDDPVCTAATQTPGCWYVDRYAPAGFTNAVLSGENVLKHSISSADSAGNRPGGYSSTFYNTQGRKLDVDLPVGFKVSANLYIPADWATDARRADLWGTVFDSGNAVSGYPILGFIANDPADPWNPNPASVMPRFRYWMDEGSGGWVDVALPGWFSYDAWYTLSYTVSPTHYLYEFSDGVNTLSFTYPTTEDHVRVGNLMLQALNFSIMPTYPVGDSYDVYWDNVTIGPRGPVATDNCCLDSVTYERGDSPSLTLYDPFPVGITTITWTATDCCGNTSSCTQTVTVEDDEAPAITCPANVTIECDESILPANTGTATAVDNCDSTPTVAYTDAPDPVSVTPGSPDGWTWFATLPLSNTPGGDGTAEMVNGPGSPPLGAGSAHLFTGTDGEQSAQLRNSSWVGTRIDALTSLTYSTYATQWNGAQLPYLTIWVDTNGDSTADDRLWFEPVYSDGNYYPPPVVQGPPALNVWQTWDTLNGLWYSDNHFGPGAASRSLTDYLVLEPNATIVNAGALGGIRIASGFASSTDVFNAYVDAFIIGTASGTTTYNFELTAGCTERVITRTWTATDDAGNSASCVQTITVEDTTAPVIPALTDVTVNNDAGLCSAVVNFTLPAITDNCSTPTVVATPPSGSTFPVGTTPVTVTATDACGNVATQSFDVIVVDAELPTIACNQTDVNVPADAGGCTASVTWNAATASDNCSATVTYEIDLGNNGSIDVTQAGTTYAFPSGTHKVTARATDPASNTATCFFLVTVQGVSELKVYLELETVMVNVNRCITFDLWDGVVSTSVNAVIPFTYAFDPNNPFGGAQASAVVIPVPCGNYTCISARDKLHTLRRTITGAPHFTVVGTQYVANFIAAGKVLLGGNLNDDQYVDVLDFGVYTWQYAANYGTPNTTCATAYPHADISGNAVVLAEDFTYIQTHFLAAREAACNGGALADVDDGPLTSISVDDLIATGQGELAAGDLNGDGMLDLADIQAFLNGARPGPRVGDANCDGGVSFFDIDAFVLALSGPQAYAAQYPGCNWLAADANGDGTVNFFDIDPFVGVLSAGQ